MQRYRILSVDGGGVRGVYAAALLERVQKESPRCLDRVDLIAGTSTGCLIALSLAFGLTPTQIVQLFIEHGKGIFTGKFLGGLVGPEYRHHYMAELLEETYGDARLGDLERHVLIPSFCLDSEGPYGAFAKSTDVEGAAEGAPSEEAAHASTPAAIVADAEPLELATHSEESIEALPASAPAGRIDSREEGTSAGMTPDAQRDADGSADNEDEEFESVDGSRCWHPRLFHNLPGDDSCHDERLVDIALRASAAPIYFPTYQGHIDGAVVANNPCMAALAQARLELPELPLDAFSILSVGTGLVPTYIENDQNWGVRQWLKPLLRLMVEGTMTMVDTQCRALLGAAYHRLDPTPPIAVKLDEVKRMEDLAEHARGLALNGTVAWLDEYFCEEPSTRRD